MLIRNLTRHSAANAAELKKLVDIAHAKRTTACTERNDDSSRSHGIAIVTVGMPGSADTEAGAMAPTSGSLYIIDLAGSER